MSPVEYVREFPRAELLGDWSADPLLVLKLPLLYNKIRNLHQDVRQLHYQVHCVVQLAFFS